MKYIIILISITTVFSCQNNNPNIKEEIANVSCDTFSNKDTNTQNDVEESSILSIYENHDFKCNNLSNNECSALRLEFVDSLLNQLFNKIIKDIDTDMKHNGEEKYNLKMKLSLIQSQEDWTKYKETQYKLLETIYDQGTERYAYINTKMIEETINRIKTLESTFTF